MPVTESVGAGRGRTDEASGALPFVTERRTIRQLPVVIAASVRARRLAELRRLLERMGEDAAGNDVMPMGSLSTAHFARLLVLERAEDLRGQVIEPQLVYMSEIDAPLALHLDQLVAFGGGLDRVFGACEGYPAKRDATDTTRREWLEAHMIDTQAWYVNTVGRTVRDILREDTLRSEIEAFVDGRDWSGADPLEVRAAIQDFVNTRPSLDWARAPVPGRPLLDVARDALGIGIPVAAALASAPLWLPVAPLYLTLLRIHELRDAVENERPTAAHERALAEIEDRGPQNQFSAIGFVKPGLLRRVTIEVGLRGIDIAARHVFNNGTLAGVKTIHFAHWTKLDQGRRVIFTSNYDGTVKSYNDDFIDKVWWGLNLAFSNGVGWPRTTFLLWGGAQHEQEFKRYLRRHQVPSQVWYSAYPDLTALNIRTNAKLRAGLVGAITPKEAEQWLRLI